MVTTGSRTEIQLWADGSGTTQGPMGFAWVLVHLATGTLREGHAGATEGTNNRAELLAVIHGLAQLKRPCRIEVVSDSEYVSKAYPRGWIDMWKHKNWRKIKNVDLWMDLDRLVEHHEEVRWRWTRGHVGVPLNESCDRRAGECRRAIIAALAEGSPITGLAFPVSGPVPQGEQMAMGA